MSEASLSLFERAAHACVAAAVAATVLLVVPELVRPRWAEWVAQYDERTFWLGSVTAVHMCVLLLGNAFFSVLYIAQLPFFERFRISPKPWPWLAGPQQRASTLRLVAASVALTLFNNLCIGVPVAWLTFPMSVKARGYTADVQAFPSVFTVVWQLAAFMVIEDAVFYASHRTLHTFPWLYRHVHKLHHTYTHSLSFAAEYAHPVEWFFGNSLPFVLGPSLLGAHGYTWLVWTVVRIGETIVNHSGYDLPCSPFRFIPFTGAANGHDAHHSMNTGNYESFFCYLDVLCGTAIPEAVIARRYAKEDKDAADASAAPASGLRKRPVKTAA